MSPRPRPTFAKLQKERARQEKQRTKAERKQQRKLEKSTGSGDEQSNELMDSNESSILPPDELSRS